MNFRETAWDQQSPPPWSFPGMTLRGFALTASMAALEDWCRRMLDDASDSSFVPALPVVFLCLAHYPKMIADSLADLGFSVQNEYFFMFPVIRRFTSSFPWNWGGPTRSWASTPPRRRFPAKWSSACPRRWARSS